MNVPSIDAKTEAAEGLPLTQAAQSVSGGVKILNLGLIPRSRVEVAQAVEWMKYWVEARKGAGILGSGKPRQGAGHLLREEQGE